jgi:D-inositol-3-phosphate glycosyltransferase
MMRVAMLSVHTCPLATLGGKKTGGMNVYIRDLSRELGRRGICVDVFTRSEDAAVPHVTPFGENVRVIHVVTGPEMSLSTAEIYAYLPEFVENVLAFARDGNLNYDIIFSHYWLSGWVAHELRAMWGVPVVQMFHTLGQMKNRIAQEPQQVETDIRIFTETDIMSWADQLIAATPAERAQILWLYRADRRKISVIPPGVDLQRFRSLPPEEARTQIGLPPDVKMLLFVGRIEPLKGIDTILRAVNMLREENPLLVDKLWISVIGGGGEDDTPDAEMVRLKELREQLGLRNLVTFLGARDQDTLHYYYGAAEALIMPSDYESFGMVALEAMACGTPVIASQVGGLAFLVQDGVTGFHVPNRDPEALVGAIRAVLTDPVRRQMMGEAAQRTAQDYGWPVIADRLLAVFEKLVRKQLSRRMN